ncbi:hypothetical protein CHH83_19680 [Bacillus sp. 7586-K]|nr:hypothetical protein CHH83_19680 [Bacillus sp. 7586-K]
MKEIVPYEDRCWNCRKYEATRLCDFVVDEMWTSLDFKRHAVTCDMPLCEKCSTRLGKETDFCPKHAKEAKEALK